MITVINTGGTFNKIYDKVKGELVIYPNCDVIEEVIAKSFYNNIDLRVTGLIYKDSLHMNDEDRAELLKKLELVQTRDVVVVHGTDTMDVSAEYIRTHAPHIVASKRIIFTGAMKPYTIEPAEATSNLTLAIGFLLYAEPKSGIYVAMNGVLGEAEKIVKDRASGKFIFA